MQKYFDIVFTEDSTNLGFEKVFNGKNLKINLGGILEKNRKAVRQKNTILLDPVLRDKAFDTAVAQIAKDNNVTIAFSFNSLLRQNGLDRVRTLKNIQEAVKICQKMKNNILICSAASDKWEQRDPQVLTGFGTILGLTLPQAKWSLSEAYEDLS